MMLGEIATAYRLAAKANRQAARLVVMAPSIPHLAVALGLHDIAHRVMVRARRRLVLSALAYLVTALIVVGVLYGLIILLWAAFGSAEPAPDFTPVQLPTL